VIKNKYIILPLLFLAWTIIFAHNIVPHHHHLAEISVGENNCHHESHQERNNHNILEASHVECCDHSETEHACHFHVEILTKVSLDNIFITHIEKSLFSDISCLEKQLINYYQEFIPDQIPQKYFLRGPPQLHNS